MDGLGKHTRGNKTKVVFLRMFTKALGETKQVCSDAEGRMCVAELFIALLSRCRCQD